MYRVYTTLYICTLYHPGYTSHTPLYPGVPVPLYTVLAVPDDEALGSKRRNFLGESLSSLPEPQECDGC